MLMPLLLTLALLLLDVVAVDVATVDVAELLLFLFSLLFSGVRLF
jgi:hypothetical protein